MTDIVTASLKAVVRAITGQINAPASEVNVAALRHGQLAVAGVHGDYFEANFNGKLFTYNVTNVTIPVVTSGVVSVFTLWNPPSSNVVGEIVRTTLGQTAAATVVDSVGWYSSTPAATAAGTFTTLAAARSSQMQSPAANAIKPYSAYTHSGTPTREDIIGAFGATTDTGMTLPDKQYNGMLALPSGIAASVCMSTAAGTATGLDIQATWAEWPTV